MKFKISSKVIDLFKDLKIGIILVKNLNNIKSLLKILKNKSLKNIKYLLLKTQDLDKISLNIELELIKDQPELIYKESENNKITDNNKNAIIFIEYLNKSVIFELALAIKQNCSSEVKVAFLEPLKEEIDLDFDNSKEDFEHKVEQDLGLLKYDSKEHEIRLEKVKEIKNLSINPWPDNLKDEDINSSIEDIKKDFQLNLESKDYKLAGRIMAIRVHGKTIFADLQDNQKIQIYLKKDNLAENKFEFFQRFIDIGDIIWVQGQAFKTKLGELTLNIKDFKLLSKCLYPLPEKFHGICDIEIKYRQRYLDLITSQDTRERFIKRSKLVRYIRQYLDDNGYIEVETPMLHPIAGGANAKPFTTHHNALSSDFFLRIAPELYLKRLVVGGFDKVYEINRNFRNEGISTRHNPEFTMIEFYTAYKDFNYAMEFTENLLRYCAEKISNNLELKFANHILDFSKPFKKISIEDSVKLYGKLDDKDLNPENIDAVVEKYKVKLKTDNCSRDEKIFALFESIVEPNLIQPTFIVDFPIEVSPLAKRNPENPEYASRFELFMAGMELANGFNELNDPFDQAKRFQDQLKAYQAGDEEAHQFDSDYILALEYGLPPTVGVGIGIDRLAMFLTNTTSIKEIILFPTLKRLKN